MFLHQNSVRFHGGIKMNEIAELINNYNSFIEDLKKLNKDIIPYVEKYNMNYLAAYWWPRDRPAWYNKKTMAAKYDSENEVFYVGYNLEDEIPYLLLERFYDLNNCKPKDFNFDDDCFNHVNDSNIEKNIDENNVYNFQQDWGKCVYAKISLIEITSREIVKTEIKSVIDYLFNKGKLSLKTIKLM